MSRYYRLDGKPITQDEWLHILEDPEKKRVALTGHGDVIITTIYLGVDHGYGYGPPLIFETMVFGGEFDKEQERYSTIEQARAGHDRWVAKVRE